MASDDTMTIHSSVHEDEDEEYDDHDQHHPRNLSRLSICTSSCNDPLEDGCGDDMLMMFMSGLSIESSSYCEGDADEEYSDDGDGGGGDHKGLHMYGSASSDSDKEIGGSCLSLPGLPQHNQDNNVIPTDVAGQNYYCSENEAAGGKSLLRNNTRRNSRRRALRERWLDMEWEKKKQNRAKDPDDMCVDLGEIKGGRDLGFEMVNQRMLDISSQVSCSTMDTASSGTTSPVPSWRISSPGDDPKDVKERLKVWAQAVATSASRQVG